MDVATLKARQDSLRAREERLVQAFRSFMFEFEEELTDFIGACVAEGVTGLQPVRQRESKPALREVGFGLRDAELLLTIPFSCHQTVIGGPLASRSFIYYAGSLDNTPLVDVTVVEADPGLRYGVFWFGSGGKRPLGGAEINEGAGGRAAHIFLDFYYELDFAWSEKPTRRVFSSEGAGPIGFGAMHQSGSSGAGDGV